MADKAQILADRTRLRHEQQALETQIAQAEQELIDLAAEGYISLEAL